MIGYGWADLEAKRLWLLLKYDPSGYEHDAYEATVFDQHGRTAIQKGKSPALALSTAINDWVIRYEGREVE